MLTEGSLGVSILMRRPFLLGTGSRRIVASLSEMIVMGSWTSSDLMGSSLVLFEPLTRLRKRGTVCGVLVGI